MHLHAGIPAVSFVHIEVEVCGVRWTLVLSYSVCLSYLQSAHSRHTFKRWICDCAFVVIPADCYRKFRLAAHQTHTICLYGESDKQITCLPLQRNNDIMPAKALYCSHTYWRAHVMYANMTPYMHQKYIMYSIVNWINICNVYHVVSCREVVMRCLMVHVFDSIGDAAVNTSTQALHAMSAPQWGCVVTSLCSN